MKQSLKGKYKHAQFAWRRWRYSFSQEQLLEALRAMGIDVGDVVLVHSSFDQFDGFTGTPSDVNRIMRNAVGPEGVLLMPTLPFRGSAIEYVSQGKIFDVKRTPSQMGLLTELFRRELGVQRSVHPTHSVAAWGSRAQETIAEHHAAVTPCGKGTPYRRLLDWNGKILFLGSDISVMTFFHCIEEDLEPVMPFSPFTSQVFSLVSRDQHGNEMVTNTRLFDPVCSRRRNLNKLIPILKRRGNWQESHIGKLQLLLLSAEAVRQACLDLARQGVFCYDS